MSNKRKWTLSKHFLLSITITAIAIVSDVLAGCGLFALGLSMIYKDFPFFGNNEAASIGIIGGADGPTAIYITGFSLLHLILNQYVILFILLMVLYKPFEYFLRKVYSNI